jgi:hypothetical protein
VNVVTGRDKAARSGFSVTRTGVAFDRSMGPAYYNPRWKALRPSTAAAALDRAYQAGGRHYEMIRQEEAVCSPTPPTVLYDP